jgi:precorrin-6B C5,15-methyltransferase / cobalt-precorrin-6B C5,C15-methyltransferase
VGEDGMAGLSALAKDLIGSAVIVFGGERHLALVAPLIRGAALRWPSPFDQTFADVLCHRGKQVCVLASGDPMHYGAGASLSRLVGADEALAVPGLSTFSLAASRLLWPVTETTLLSLGGRSLHTIRPYLQPGARVLALSASQRTAGELAALLCDLGFGATKITALEALGGSRERIRTTTAEQFDLSDIAPLNTLALEIAAGQTAAVITRASGLPDDYFEHDGQLTKREVRAVTLSALAPRSSQLLWDVGAGAGSVAIEWMLSDRSVTAIAVECRADRAERIGRNARSLGVPDLKVVEGRAPAALAGLPRPDAVFVGGGVNTAGLIETVQAAVAPGGRVVANAVSLESEACLLKCYKTFGGHLTRIAISRADRLGDVEGTGVAGWRGLMPITQWTWMKP